jgi:hypothetical protein
MEHEPALAKRKLINSPNGWMPFSSRPDVDIPVAVGRPFVLGSVCPVAFDTALALVPQFGGRTSACLPQPTSAT